MPKIHWHLNYFNMFCDKVFVKSMYIDEQRQFAFTNFHQKKKGKHSTTSDHSLLVANFELKCVKQPKERKCLFNYNNSESLLKFKNVTTKTDKFTNCFLNNKPFLTQVKSWERIFNQTLYVCFDKIRLKSVQKPILKSYISQLLDQRKVAILNRDFQKREDIERKIHCYEKDQSIDVVSKNIKRLRDKTMCGFWKLKAKLFPKKRSKIPVAKKNQKGQIITNHFELKNVYLDHFKFRMRERPILPKYEYFKKQVEMEFDIILKKTEKIKLKDWDVNDLNTVLKSLKMRQSQDTKGWSNELFCFSNIGENLKSSVLEICNHIKNSLEIPDFFKDVFISSIPKKKINPLSLEAECGIFLVNKLRSVFMRLLYNSNIEQIENNLSNANIGGRKKILPETIYLLSIQ